jgi:hypothetical protein
MKLKEESKAPSGGIRCWNGITGCEKTIYGCWWNSQACLWEAPNYNSGAHLCVPCSDREAEKWNVNFSDLSFVFTAIQIGQAGRMGKPAPPEEINRLLDRMGVKRKSKIPVRPMDNTLPQADRLEVD